MKKAKYLSYAAIIAALYVVLTWSFSFLQNGMVQFRISEALTVLVAFTPAAVPGLFIGCLISNIIAGNVIDIVFGSLTTLLAAVVGRMIANKLKTPGIWRALLSVTPAVVFNALTVPIILYYGYGFKDIAGQSEKWAVLAINAACVFVGQAAVCFILGSVLYLVLREIDKKHSLFR